MSYKLRQDICKSILLINFDENKKIFKDKKIIEEKFENTDFNKYTLIIVCTQNSLSGTEQHFQHQLESYLLNLKNNSENIFELLSKSDATRQVNRRHYLLFKNHNVRTRVYYQKGKVNFNFPLKKFKYSYSLTKDEVNNLNNNEINITKFSPKLKSKNSRFINTKKAKLIEENYRKYSDFSKLQLYDYSVKRESSEKNSKPIIGEGRITTNLVFIYQYVRYNYLFKLQIVNENNMGNINVETYPYEMLKYICSSNSINKSYYIKDSTINSSNNQFKLNTYQMNELVNLTTNMKNLNSIDINTRSFKNGENSELNPLISENNKPSNIYDELNNLAGFIFTHENTDAFYQYDTLLNQKGIRKVNRIIDLLLAVYTIIVIFKKLINENSNPIRTYIRNKDNQLWNDISSRELKNLINTIDSKSKNIQSFNTDDDLLKIVYLIKIMNRSVLKDYIGSRNINISHYQMIFKFGNYNNSRNMRQHSVANLIYKFLNRKITNKTPIETQKYINELYDTLNELKKSWNKRKN